MLTCGGSLTQVQVVYAAVLAANAALAGAITWRLGAPRWAPLAAAWLYALDARLEGHAACAERIATLPLLAGVLLWGGAPLRGRAGLLRAVVLGACLGLATHAKRQAGLLGVGVLALGVRAAVLPANRRDDARALTILPAVAAVTLALLVLPEGRGLAPVWTAFGALARYEPQGTWVGNLRIVFDGAPCLFAIFVAALAGFVALVRGRRRPDDLARAGTAVAMLLASGGLATLVQFAKRAYPHHALLAAPGAVLGVFGVLAAHARDARARVLVLAATLLVMGGSHPFGVTLLGRPSLGAPDWTWPRDPRTEADLERLISELRPGENVLLLPPSGRNQVHFRARTRSRGHALGYNWAPELGASLRSVEWGRIDAVVTLRRGDSADAAAWDAFDVGSVVSGLPSRGFQVVSTTPSFRTWRRSPR